MKRFAFLLVFLAFTRPDGDHVWFAIDQIVSFSKPPRGFCDKAANTVIEGTNGRFICVLEPPDLVAQEIHEAKN